jgi:hypothetical protein
MNGEDCENCLEALEKWICPGLSANKNPPIQRVLCTALESIGLLIGEK